MQTARRGMEFKDGTAWVFRMRRRAIPHARAAMNALLAIKRRHAFLAGRDRLTAANLDADLRAAALTQIGYKKTT